VPEVLDPRWSHEDALELTDALQEQVLPVVTTKLPEPP
jgi:hypothetical protein